jgi:4'-phosphopantetheinyl transferase
VASFLHLWQADLTTALPPWSAVEATLSAAETARQVRLRTPALRQTYSRAHGFLRAVLSQYTEEPASTLGIYPDAQGKPMLPGNGLHFNLSYRPGRALLAVSDAYPVGVDVEPLTPLADVAALIRELYAPAEQAALRAAAPADYWRLFYTIWTRKEAYAKALGRGVGMPFSTFSVVEFEPGQPLAFIAPAGAMLHHRALAGDYQGAVATLSNALPIPEIFTYFPTDSPTASPSLKQ